LLPDQVLLVSGSLAATINVRSNAVFQSRPFDGGVLMGPGTPTRGAAATRVTKKYFRYQSGKGILFSTGTVLAPTFGCATVTQMEHCQQQYHNHH
jgi:hypothetical protein